jgi:DNA repair protein RadC
LILDSQKQAAALLKHFGSLIVLGRASVQELLPFVSRSKALRLVSSLRMGAAALREERQSLTIDSPLAIADLCSEMRFLDRESLRLVLLNAKRWIRLPENDEQAVEMTRIRRLLRKPFSPQQLVEFIDSHFRESKAGT